MSILRPINYAGAWEFKSPVPCPSGDILSGTQVSIAFNETWIPAVYSAIKALTRPEAWIGTLADINRVTVDAHCLFDAKVRSTLRPGTIVLNLTQTWPANWLACDGHTYLRTDWPELYAVLHSNFIIDADHFFVPNLRGRFPIVAGSGTGLTQRVIGQSGGEENHTLSLSETPSHEHISGTVIGLADVSGQAPGSNWGFVAAQSGTRWGFGNEASRGSDAAHENMPPFYVVQFSIIASSD